MPFEPHIVASSSRAAQFGEGVRRFRVGGAGGTHCPTVTIAATSQAEALEFYRRVHGLTDQGIFGHLLVVAHVLED
jgi:hypothetical protein